MNGHTPGKWDVAIARGGYNGLYQIWDENGNAPKDEEEEANAEFIVRACNSHEELLEALKNLLGFHCSPEMLPAGASERCAVVNAELAIIHAEKKE